MSTTQHTFKTQQITDEFTFTKIILTKKTTIVFLPVVEMSTPLFGAGFRLFIDGGYKVKPELLF